MTTFPTTLTAGLFRHGACTATLRISYWQPGADGRCSALREGLSRDRRRSRPTRPVPSWSCRGLRSSPRSTTRVIRARLYAAAIRAGIMGCIALDATHLLVATQTKWKSVLSACVRLRSGCAGAVLSSRKCAGQFFSSASSTIRLLSRIANNMFFKTDPGEIDELRGLLSGPYAGRRKCNSERDPPINSAFRRA